MKNQSDTYTWRVPGEFEPHQATLMIWPTRPGSWPWGGADAKKTFCEIMKIILKTEDVYLLADRNHTQEAAEMAPEGVHILTIENDDAWARDTCPIFILSSNKGSDQTDFCQTAAKQAAADTSTDTAAVQDKYSLTGLDWGFNAWGGKTDGLYASWEKDAEVAAEVCRQLDIPCINLRDFVLEGGSIYSDGEGTLLTTEACLLSEGREHTQSKESIEQLLCYTFGAEQIIWLPRGILGDETNEHVDNICAFVKPGEVVLAWPDDQSSPQYALSKACLDVLENIRDAKGRKLTVHKLPLPAAPITLTEEDVKGYTFEEGEAVRVPGEELAASYVNFYFINNGVLVPQFQDANDEKVLQIFRELFPDRTIYPIPARAILAGGGGIHCITQQIPAV